MSTVSLTILCGACRTPVAAPDNAAPHDLVTCTECGQSDTLEDVFASAKAYATESVRLGLSDRMEKAARESKFLSFTPGEASTLQFRWTCEGMEV